MKTVNAVIAVIFYYPYARAPRLRESDHCIHCVGREMLDRCIHCTHCTGTLPLTPTVRLSPGNLCPWLTPRDTTGGTVDLTAQRGCGRPTACGAGEPFSVRLTAPWGQHG